MGEMLWSAIRRGGLLDEQLWPTWVTGAQDAISISGTLVAVDLLGAAAGAPEAEPRRWIADPVTGLMIVRWHRDALRLPERCSVKDCLRAYRGADAVPVAAILEEYGSAEALRLPGLMLAYAKGDIACTSVPQATWQQLLYGTHDPASDQPAVKPLQVPPREQRDVSAHEETLQPELRILDRPAPRYDAGRKAVVRHKSQVRKAIAALPPTAGIHGELRNWCLFALARERAGRVSIGYTPSTTRKYLNALAKAFSGWRGGALSDAPSATIEDHVHRVMPLIDARARADAAKGILSLQRHLNPHRAHDPLDIDLGEYFSEAVRSPNIVPPHVYARALSSLEQKGEADLALILTLMFRAGLRLEEAVALRVGDVCAADQILELVIEENDERTLKTKTSRRIIPLDVLLDEPERTRLIERVEMRRGDAMGAEAWLFGHRLANSTSRLKPVRGQIDHALRHASGLIALNHGHLRHSFASYLLTTLMLPQDIADPPIPERLRTVISPARFARVADRLLGRERLGAGALHAVAQLMGHTGPRTALRYYCHLLDLSLGLYCGRPSTLPACDAEWLIGELAVGPDARRKAIERAAARIAVSMQAIDHDHRRPDASEIIQNTPSASRKLADARMLEVGTKRLARPIASALSMAIDARSRQRDRIVRSSVASPAEATRSATRAARPYMVPWRSMMLDLGDRCRRNPALRNEPICPEKSRAEIDWLRAAAPKTPEFARFVDQHLALSRQPRTAERAAVASVVSRWHRGETDIRIKRLGDGEAFVELLSVMGFARKEIALSVTGAGGRSLSSTMIHRFLNDRSVAPRLAGRTGWRGSLVVRLQPAGLGMPILAARVCRFALMMIALDAQRVSAPVAGER